MTVHLRDNDAEELKSELDIELWLEDQGIAFRPGMGSSGRQLNLTECPCCGSRTSRAYVNAESGLGNCFKCGESWNKLSLMRFVLGEPDWRDVFAEARRFLKEQGWRPARKVTAAVEPPKAKLPTSFALPTVEGRNLTYLAQRGVGKNLAAYFHLRMCMNGWWNFEREDGTQGGQNFSGRLIIPVYDLDGTFVTFQGRDVTGLREPKYLFPMTLPGTGRYLFNGQNVAGTRRLAMGEGAFDVIAMKRAFDEDPTMRDIVPVGSFGKHLSHGSDVGDDQLSRLRSLKGRGLAEVTIMWDGEAKALEAALNAARRIRNIGLLARVALLPKDRDPNEVLPEVVREAFRRAKPWTQMLDMGWRLKNPYAS